MAYPQDKLLADRLIQRDVAAWEEFRRRYESRILYVAVRWCGPSCRPDCPGYGGGARNNPSLQVVCPIAFDAYTFIVEKLIDQLKFYRGDCSLDTWFYPLLTPHSPSRQGSERSQRRYDYHKLFADYIRDIRGRIRPPKCIPKSDHKLFLMTAHQKTPEEIAATLRLPATEVKARQERVIEQLKSESYGQYWQILRAPALLDEPGSLDQERMEEDDGPSASREPADQDPPIDTTITARLIVTLLRKIIRNMPDLDRALLSLRYDRIGAGTSAATGLMEAGEIAAVFSGLGSRDLTEEGRVRTRLRTLIRQLTDRLDAELGKNTYLDANRMDDILKEWGTGAPEIAQKLVAVSYRKSVLSHPSNSPAGES